MASYHESQISQWLEDVYIFAFLCRKIHDSHGKMHQFCEMFLQCFSSTSPGIPWCCFPSTRLQKRILPHILYTASNGVVWMLVVVRSLRSGNPCDCRNFSTHSCTKSHGHFHQKMMLWKRWSSACIAVDIGIWYISGCTRSNSGYITFLDGFPRKKPGFLLAEVHPIIFNNTWLPTTSTIINQ